LKPALDLLYAGFNHPESALDPIQIVRRYERLDDREIVAFIAAGLAFGRVASVMASVEAVCAVLGPSPAAFVRAFEPARHGGGLEPIVHRWTRGRDLIALVWVLRQMLDTSGSIERFFAEGLDPSAADVGAALESFSTRAMAFHDSYVAPPELRSAANRPTELRSALRTGAKTPAKLPGVAYFFSRPSTGGACKRLNLFLRWMVRRDGVDAGGWTMVPARQLIVPLDTHTIRTGRCLRLTRRTSPGWKMAADITAALRALNTDDPVRYDFSLCHLSMMGACGFGTKQGSSQCPLRGHCRPSTRATDRRQRGKGRRR
jgi:uncharacterized protein (TIGR02757 family)